MFLRRIISCNTSSCHSYLSECPPLMLVWGRYCDGHRDDVIDMAILSPYCHEDGQQQNSLLKTHTRISLYRTSNKFGHLGGGLLMWVNSWVRISYESLCVSSRTACLVSYAVLSLSLLSILCFLFHLAFESPFPVAKCVRVILSSGFVL